MLYTILEANIYQVNFKVLISKNNIMQNKQAVLEAIKILYQIILFSTS